MIHILIDKGFKFLLISVTDFPNRRAFTYLRDIQQRFLSQFGDRAKTVMTENSLNKDFRSTLRKLMRDYDESHENPIDVDIQDRKEEIERVKGIMIKNIDIVLERSDKLELLYEQSEDLAPSSTDFHIKSQGLLRARCRTCLILICILVCIILLVVPLIVWIACGIPAFDRCVENFSKKKKKN